MSQICTFEPTRAMVGEYSAAFNTVTFHFIHVKTGFYLNENFDTVAIFRLRKKKPTIASPKKAQLISCTNSDHPCHFLFKLLA